MSKKPSKKSWHRLFGISLKNVFLDRPYQVELEMDLSVRQQFLDIVIIKKTDADPSLSNQSPPVDLTPLPDGLDNFAVHNLMTYKSMREPLNGWALDELIGHYVNYRKQTSPDPNKLLPQKQFQLYAVCTRFPLSLHKLMPLTKLQNGVYEITWDLHPIRVIVLKRIPQAPHNALWNMFSSVRETVAYGSNHFQVERGRLSTIINQLFEFYHLEGVKMPYTMEDFERDYARTTFMRSVLANDALKIEMIDQMFQADSKTLTQEVLQRLSPEERLKDVSVEERLKDVPVEERLKDLSPAEIEAYLQQRKAEEGGNQPASDDLGPDEMT